MNSYPIPPDDLFCSHHIYIFVPGLFKVLHSNMQNCAVSNQVWIIFAIWPRPIHLVNIVFQFELGLRTAAALTLTAKLHGHLRATQLRV